MSTVLVVDGEPRSPQGIGLVGTQTPHGFHQLVDGILHLGAFALAPGPTLLRLIAGGEKVQIPPEALSEFAVDVLPRLRRTVAVDMPEGLFAEPDIVGPLPVLSITAGDVDGHVKWRTRYEVNGQRQEFDAVGVTRTSGIRDNAAEDAMWRAIAPALELISGLSATDDPLASLLLSRRQSLPQIAVLCHEVLPQLAGYEQLIVEIDERAAAFRRSVAGAQLGFGTASSDEAPAQDWFDLHITIDVDGHPVALSAVIAELALGATHMLLSNGVYFRLDTPELLKLRALIEEAQNRQANRQVPAQKPPALDKRNRESAFRGGPGRHDAGGAAADDQHIRLFNHRNAPGRFLDEVRLKSLHGDQVHGVRVEKRLWLR